MSSSSSASREGPSNTKRNVLGALAVAAAVAGGVGYKVHDDNTDRARHENLDPAQHPAEYSTAPSRYALGQIMRGGFEYHQDPAAPELQQVAASLIDVNKTLNACVDSYDALTASFRVLCVSNPDCMNQLVSTDEALLARFRTGTTLTSTMTSDMRALPINESSVSAGFNNSDAEGRPLGSMEQKDLPSADLRRIITSIHEQQARLRECQAFSATLGQAVERLQNRQPVVPLTVVDAGNTDAATDADDATPNTDPNTVRLNGTPERPL